MNLPHPPTDARTLSCGAARARLIAWRDNELADDEAAAVAAHVGDCTACAAVRDAYAATLRVASPDAYPVATVDIASQVLTAILLADADPAALAAARAEADRLPFIDLPNHRPEPDALGAIPAELARRLGALPVRKQNGTIFVAMRDPRDIAAVDEIRLAARCVVRPLAAAPDALNAALETAYPPEPPTTTTPSVEAALLHEALDELRALRTEMTAMRGEMDGLRRQIAATRAASRIPPKPAAPRLFPYAPPADLPSGRNG